MPRMTLALAFTPFRKVEDQQQPPVHRLPSALVEMMMVNPHQRWPASVAHSLERIFEKLCPTSMAPSFGDTSYSSQHSHWLYAANLPMGPEPP